MSELVFTESFIDEMAHVASPRVRGAIFDAIELLATLPEFGSPDLPDSIVKKYGSSVRKLVVAPFLVIYQVLPDDRVLILGLMHIRASW